jgi:hypothetical protein
MYLLTCVPTCCPRLRKRGLRTPCGRYEGEWEQGQRDGMGRLQHHGNLYDGMFRAGLPDGRGRVVFVNGDMLQGLFKQGHASGGCTLHTRSAVFKGEFRAGNKHGYATVVRPPPPPSLSLSLKLTARLSLSPLGSLSHRSRCAKVGI